jgi:hypothetical protein
MVAIKIKVPGKGAKVSAPHSLQLLKTVYIHCAGAVSYGKYLKLQQYNK